MKSARAQGRAPRQEDLSFLSKHHSGPRYKEYRQPMGRKQEWQNQRQEQASWWRSGSGYGAAEWTDHYGKGYGKKGKVTYGEYGQPSFPSYDAMQLSGQRQAKSAGKGDRKEIAEGSSEAGGLVKLVQKWVNTIRRADGRARKGETDKEAAEAQWQEYQRKLRQSFLQERQRYYEKVNRIKQEQAEMIQQKEEAIKNLRTILTKPEELAVMMTETIPAEAAQEWADLMAEPEDPWAGLPTLLAGATQAGPLQANAGQQLGLALFPQWTQNHGTLFKPPE